MEVLSMFGAQLGQAGIFGIFQPVLNALQYASYQKTPNLIPDPMTLVALRHRGKLEPAKYVDLMTALGYSESLAESIYETSNQILGIGEIINLDRRNIVKGEALDTLKEYAGVDDPQYALIKKAQEPLASARDVIEFAVREVYSPEIAEEFGQYERAREIFQKAKDDLAAIGMPEELFTKYWAAHWALPSLGEGFEMLHRGVIREDELDKLLEAADYMPRWREYLKEITYTPYTRVDIRRMHKIGVLSSYDVFSAYVDLGYNFNSGNHHHQTREEAWGCEQCRAESHAGRITEFVIRYNGDPEQLYQTDTEVRANKERDLTKAEILRGYHNRLIEPETAKDYLMNLGYDEAEAEYYLHSEDYKIIQHEIESMIGYVHDGFIKGLFSENDAVARLGSLNLKGPYIDQLLSKWQTEREIKNRLPSRADLMNFYKAGIIDEPTLRDELSKQNYPDKYIDWYIKSLSKR